MIIFASILLGSATAFVTIAIFIIIYFERKMLKMHNLD
jgi:NADH:ubiquinone oxidoreductase subunit K